ncbi:MAG TPA: S8 family serine peptidase [Verrucomicrobiae bacterium]|nr:S8 family serine peptidase [Verrucomicrobiae bacterium]
MVGLIVFLFVSIAGAKEHPRFVPGQILIKPRAGVSEKALMNKLNSHGAHPRFTLRHLNVRVVNVSEQNADAVLAALRNDPDIEFAERDYVAQAAFVPNDPYVGDEWHLAKIQAFQAWQGTTGSGNVVVAVLDSGVNMNQPDLAGRLLPGYDFVNGTASVTDDFGHGTAVCGTVAADGNNNLGVAGVAYGCSVLPVKVMDSSGFAAYSTIAAGIKYAVDNGALVINLSIAGSDASSTLQQAIDYAWSNNVVVVAAAGNAATNTPMYPAACNHVLGVSATAQDDSLAYFSSYGSFVQISAPGTMIWTTQSDTNHPFGAWQGTSFASPVVAGVAALVLSANPTLSNDQVVSLLEQSADDLGAPGYDAYFGYGRVNALRAVSLASAAPGATISMPAEMPAVVLSSPTNSQFAPGTSIPLQAIASASTAGGTITNFAFVVDGVTVASGSGSTLSFNWTPTQAGEYSIIAVATDDQGLTATSAAANIQVGNGDTVPPTIAISTPARGAKLTTPNVFISGTANDNIAVQAVEVSVNNGPPQLANGTTSWTAQVSLVAGPNIIRAYSVDTSGNVSTNATLSLTLVATSALTIQTSGQGTVSPNLNGAQLQIGKTYTVKANPAAGQAFAGWNGVVSQSRTLTFVMQSNLVLTASFVPSPFPAVTGDYAGLAANTNAITPDNSGYFRVTVTAAGVFSGKLLLGGGRYGFHGQFDVSGNATTVVNRGPALTPLSFALHIDLSNGTDQVTGLLTDGAWASGASADKNVFNSRLNPAEQAGSRNFILQEANDAAVEAGLGLGRISTSGLANVSGSLDNGTKFRTSSTLAKNGDCPFYLSLNKGNGIVIGWLNFPAAASPTASGTVLWVNSGTNQFSAELRAASAPPR